MKMIVRTRYNRAPAGVIENVEEKKFNSDPKNKEAAKEHGYKVKNMKGGTSGKNKDKITLKSTADYSTGRSFKKTALHEIFHTFFFNKDGSMQGIGSGGVVEPSEKDIMKLIEVIPKKTGTSKPVIVK